MKSPFIWGQGGRAMTPEEVARQRELVALARSKMGDTSPVGDWTQGATRVVDALGGVLREKRTNKAEAAGMAGADAYIQNNPVLSALIGGGGMPAPAASSSAALPVAVDPNNPAALGKPAVRTGADPASIRAGLVARGLPEHVADGFVMNFRDESGFNPGINEANPTVPGSRGGYGLYQLTGPRRVAYEAFAAERGVPVDDVDAQLDFLMTELQGPEAAAANAILSTKDAGQAGAAIVNEFLRPAEDHAASRTARYTSGGAYSGGGMSSEGRPVPMAGGGADVTAALAAAMSDPWVAKKYGPVLEALMGQNMKRSDMQYQSQLAQSDPMYQAQLEAQQLELEAMRNPVAQPREPIEVGGVLLDPLTYEPIFDSRTADGGKAPETQVFFDEATGQEYRAQWNGQEWVQIGGTKAPSGPLVENNIGGADGKFEEAFAKGDAATVETVNNAGLAAQRNLGRIDQLEGILSSTPTGMGASLAQAAGEWGIPTEGLSEIQAAQALINSLVPEQRQPGSGPMSDADLALFKQSLPRIINQPGGNQVIIDTMRAIAQYDAEGAAIVQRMRLPPDDPNYLDRSAAFSALQNRPNPLESIKAAGGGGTPESSGAKTRLSYNPATGEFE